MADNYLEKRYAEVFGSGSSVDAETGYSAPSALRPRSKKGTPAELPAAEDIDVQAVKRNYLKGAVDLIVILGPTASGKTRYAVQLARLFGNAEIISADSRQIYRGMDIGTGKDLSEYGDIPYHLIDIAEPGDKYNVFEFCKDFSEAYEGIRSRGAIPILCGGTGLYINAVTAGYDFRQHQPLSQVKPAAMKPYFIGTLVDRDTRNARIDERLDARLKEGMVEEIRGLLDKGVPAGTLLGYGLEYRFVTRYILGDLSFEQMRQQLGTAIHQFAKRQMTWFRGMERSGVRIHWVEV